jgi:hypothetical protein
MSSQYLTPDDETVIVTTRSKGNMNNQELLAVLRQTGGGFAAAMINTIGEFDQEIHLVQGYSGEDDPAKKPTLN